MLLIVIEAIDLSHVHTHNTICRKTTRHHYRRAISTNAFGRYTFRATEKKILLFFILHQC